MTNPHRRRRLRAQAKASGGTRLSLVASREVIQERATDEETIARARRKRGPGVLTSPPGHDAPDADGPPLT